MTRIFTEDGDHTIVSFEHRDLDRYGENAEAVRGDYDTGMDGGWRELLSGAGVRSISVSAAGIFLGSTAEARIRANAMAGTLDSYELSFEGGERLRGQFLIQRLDYAGDFNGERNYTVQLESSGEVVPA